MRLAALFVALLATACSPSRGRTGTDDPGDEVDAGPVISDGGACARPCGGGCCGEGTTCVSGRCEVSCVPSCAGRQCGSNGCGGSCGSCPSGFCNDATGACSDECVPSCVNRDCGTDGCGGSCGSCGDGESCGSDGRCVGACVRQCAGRACGFDGCGGECGTCPDGASCNANGACVTSCVPDCLGRVCGPDTCGHSCGECTSGTCNVAGRCEVEGGGPRWTAIGDLPKPMTFAASAFDTRRSRTAYGFGLVNAAACRSTTTTACAFQASLVEFDGSSFANVALAGAPSTRLGVGLVYDAAKARYLVFGGLDASNNVLGEAWVLPTGVNGAWSKLGVAQGFAAGAAGFSASPFVLFGGYQSVGSAGTPSGNTVSFDGTQFASLSYTGPGPRSDLASTTNGAGELVIFGGADANAAVLGDTWILNRSTGWRMPASVGPTARYGAAMTYDPVGDRVLLFGGEDGAGNDSAELWSFKNDVWTRLSPSGSTPPARVAHFFERAPGGRFLLAGGVQNSGGSLSERQDAWLLSFE